jgi:hypothetical protein
VFRAAAGRCYLPLAAAVAVTVAVSSVRAADGKLIRPTQVGARHAQCRIDRKAGPTHDVIGARRYAGSRGRAGEERRAGHPMISEMEDESVRVLDEGDAVELLVYLVTAARTQVDEAAEYAPMRLLTAAGRLAEMAEPNASARLRPLLREIRQGFSETAIQAGDPAGYVERLDALCRTVAEYLVRSLGLDRSA